MILIARIEYCDNLCIMLIYHNTDIRYTVYHDMFKSYFRSFSSHFLFDESLAHKLGKCETG